MNTLFLNIFLKKTWKFDIKVLLVSFAYIYIPNFD